MAVSAAKKRAGRDDRDRRRREVIQAAWRVIARDGLGQASMRAIAHELGCTTGVLTHYFRDKDDIIAVAIEEVGRATRERIEKAVAKKAPREALSAFAHGFLPTDPAGRRIWVVWIQFLAMAAKDRRMLKRNSRQYDEARERIVDLLGALQGQGALPGDLDREREADHLLALLDGLGTHALISPERYTPEAMAGFVETHIARLAAATKGKDT